MMTPTVTVSPSALKVWRTCKRKWAFQYFGGFPRTTSAAQEFGLELHAAAERWIRDGVQPDTSTKAGRLFVEGIPLLPKPGTAQAEVDFSVPMADWWCYHGQIDVLRGAEVWDHKTTSNPKFALTAETCRTDPQVIIYAYAALQIANASACNTHWIYYDKSAKRAWSVDNVWTIDSVLAALAEHVEVDAVQLATEKRRLSVLSNYGPVNPNEQTPNYAACNDYGRPCEFQAHCKQPEVEKRMSRFAIPQNVQSKMENLRNNPEMQKLRQQAELREEIAIVESQIEAHEQLGIPIKEPNFDLPPSCKPSNGPPQDLRSRLQRMRAQQVELNPQPSALQETQVMLSSPAVQTAPVNPPEAEEPEPALPAAEPAKRGRPRKETAAPAPAPTAEPEPTPAQSAPWSIAAIEALKGLTFEITIKVK